MLNIIQDLPLVVLLIVLGVSLYAIIKGADYFVRGASSVSLKLGVSAFVIGLTVIAIGTSAPEFFINIIAAHSGATDLSIGNIFGSNMAGILLGLGIASLITPLTLKTKTVWKEIPFSALGAFLVLLFGSDVLLDGAVANVLTRVEGITLLSFFIIFIIYTFSLSETDKVEDDQNIQEFSWLRSILYIIGGVAILLIGGELTVDAATVIASMMGMSQNLVGLTIVAVGTSLPEIATTIIAAKKGQIDLAVGGIVGTIIFNIFFALGSTAVVAHLPFKQDNVIDALFLIFISILFFLFMFVGKKHKLERWQGISFIILYVVYILFAVLREML